MELIAVPQQPVFKTWRYEGSPRNDSKQGWRERCSPTQCPWPSKRGTDSCSTANQCAEYGKNPFKDGGSIAPHPSDLALKRGEKERGRRRRGEEEGKEEGETREGGQTDRRPPPRGTVHPPTGGASARRGLSRSARMPQHKANSRAKVDKVWLPLGAAFTKGSFKSTGGWGCHPGNKDEPNQGRIQPKLPPQEGQGRGTSRPKGGSRSNHPRMGKSGAVGPKLHPPWIRITKKVTMGGSKPEGCLRTVI